MNDRIEKDLSWGSVEVEREDDMKKSMSMSKRRDKKREVTAMAMVLAGNNDSD